MRSLRAPHRRWNRKPLEPRMEFLRPTPRDTAIARRLRDIDKLSKRDRDALSRTIDAFLTRAKPE